MHVLWVHDERFSALEVVINAEAFPTVSVGDLLEVFHANSVAERRLVVQVTALDPETAAKQPHLHISIAQHLAALFELQPRAHVVVQKVDRDEMRAEFMELSFKDQYIARSDMWRLKLALINKCVYTGKKIQTLGVRAQVKDLVIGGKEAACAVVTESTKLVFRSHSAKFFIFVQMSNEMWEFDDDGQLYFEKCVHGFLPALFSVWKKDATNHIVSIVLFTRILYQDSAGNVINANSLGISSEAADLMSQLSVDFTGRRYRDFYRVVVDWETRSDWADVLVPLKREFVKFKQNILGAEQERFNFLKKRSISCAISSAPEGNILEAINLALNPFDKHYIDRDLSRTGLAIVVISPSPGHFAVDKQLLRLTTQRCVDNGIACDLVSLSKPPLFSVPLLQFFGKKGMHRMDNPNSGEGSGTAPSAGRSGGGGPTGAEPRMSGVSQDSADTSNLRDQAEIIWDPLYVDDGVSYLTNESERAVFFNIPTWFDVSFYDRSNGGASSRHKSDTRNRRSQFSLRCRLPETPTIGVDLMPCFEVDYLDMHSIMNSANHTPTDGQLISPYDRFDAQVFSRIHEIPFNAESVAELPGSRPMSVGSYSTNASRHSLHDAMSMSLGQKLLPPVNLVEQRRTSLLSTHTGAHPAILGSSLKNLVASSSITTTIDSDGSSFDTSNLDATDLMFEKVKLVEAPAFGQRSVATLGSANDAKPPTSPATNLAPIRIIGAGTTRHHKDSSDSGTMEKLVGSYKGGTSPSIDMAFGRGSPGKTPTNMQLQKTMNLRLNYINPFNPSKNIIKASSTVRRWQHVFPLSHNHNDEMVKWKSLSTPASLPISTDFFPTKSELAQQYVEQLYTVTTDDDLNPPQNYASEVQRAEALLVELISQRISQGFQIVVSQALDKVPLAPVNEDLAPTTAAPSKFWAAGPSAAAAAAAAAAASSNSMVGGALAGGSLLHSGSGIGPMAFPGTALLPSQSMIRVQAATLSLGDHLHRLTFDPTGKNVEVKKYTRLTRYSQEAYTYKCMIWPNNMPEFTETNAVFMYPLLSNYSWNYLDHWIAGFWDDMTEALRFWRARFILIPLESVQSIYNPFEGIKLEEEDLRIAGFNRFVELFEKCKWQNSSLQQQQQQLPPIKSPSFHEGGFSASKKSMMQGGGVSLNIQLTTLPKSQFVKEEWARLIAEEQANIAAGRASSVSDHLLNESSNNFLTKNSPFLAIVEGMQQPETGVAIKDRTWHGKGYKKIFIGRECINWMVRAFADITTREEATAFGNELLTKGVFEHANLRHRFLDGYFYYRVSKEYMALREREVALLKEKEGRGKGGSRSGSTSDVSNGMKRDDSENPLRNSSMSDSLGECGPDGDSGEDSNAHLNIPPIELSRRLTIDMDPHKRSTRKEMALLHYDTTHNTKNCYHFQLHWLVCTPRLIEDLLQGWSRTAERCGFKMVEAPIEQASPFSNDSPFQSVILIPLVVPVSHLSSARNEDPSTLSNTHEEREFLHEIARRNDFLLDVESDDLFDPDASVAYSGGKPQYAYTQFVHRSGAAFIQIVPGTGFYWVNNRLHLAGSSGGGGAGSAGGTSVLNVDKLRDSFKAFCSDAAGLRRMWNEMHLFAYH
ncbi:vacuolar membrane-associated protein iml1 [Chytriomyces hyalinus]|nr:vacuolar membrane-associated protein iml1 [Chytriomyces hyalinus]